MKIPRIPANPPLPAPALERPPPVRNGIPSAAQRRRRNRRRTTLLPQQPVAAAGAIARIRTVPMLTVAAINRPLAPCRNRRAAKTAVPTHDADAPPTKPASNLRIVAPVAKRRNPLRPAKPPQRPRYPQRNQNYRRRPECERRHVKQPVNHCPRGNARRRLPAPAPAGLNLSP